MSEQNRRAEAWTVVIAQYSHHRYRRKPFPLRLAALSPLFCHHQRCGQLHTLPRILCWVLVRYRHSLDEVRLLQLHRYRDL